MEEVVATKLSEQYIFRLSCILDQFLIHDVFTIIQQYIFDISFVAKHRVSFPFINPIVAYWTKCGVAITLTAGSEPSDLFLIHYKENEVVMSRQQNVLSYIGYPILNVVSKTHIASLHIDRDVSFIFLQNLNTKTFLLCLSGELKHVWIFDNEILYSYIKDFVSLHLVSEDIKTRRTETIECQFPSRESVICCVPYHNYIIFATDKELISWNRNTKQEMLPRIKHSARWTGKIQIACYKDLIVLVKDLDVKIYRICDGFLSRVLSRTKK